VDAGKRFFVYRNITKSKDKHVYSLRSKEDSRVKGHSSAFYLTDVKFKVSDAGRDRVRKEGVKNVHAGIEGTLASNVLKGPWIPVTYNPKVTDGFVRKDTREGITTARAAKFTPEGVYVKTAFLQGFEKRAEDKALYKPKPSTRPGKKYQVYVKGDSGNPKLIHFGATGYKHNYSADAKKNFRARHNCDGADKNTPKWWACNYLWGTNQRVGTKTNRSLTKEGSACCCFWEAFEKQAQEIAKKKDPAKWSRAKARAVSKMGGKWSARAAQLATKYYKDAGGTYEGKKPASNSLSKWTKQKWQPNPHAKNRPDPSIAKDKSGNTTRYLPENKWKSLSKNEASATDKKKREASKQWVPNTEKAKVRS
jgi:hypothetical protein